MSQRLLLLLLIKLLHPADGQAQLPKIWIGATGPMTGGGWDAGIPVLVGGNLMLDEVNKNPTLLPDYNLSILWQDDKCIADHARNLFLRNIFEEKYEVFAPGVNRSDLDVDGDGLIESSDTDPLMQVWGRAEVDPPPVAYMGQGCSGGTGPVIPIAYYAQAPFVSPTATFPGLSDRTKYPNFFRTQMPDSFSYFALLDIVSFLGHNKLVILSGNSEAWKAAARGLSTFAGVLNIQMLGRDLNSDIAGFTGFILPSDSATAVTDIVSQLISLQPRFVMILEYKDPVAAVVCEAVKRGYTTAVYMVIGWLEFGWWTSAQSTCTAAQIQYAASSMLMAKMVYWRIDRQTPLTCAPNITADTIFQRWFTQQGAPPGQLMKVADGYTLYDDGASAADAVCMYALALHKMIYVKNFTVAQLAARGPTVYNTWQEVLAETDFEGVIGRVSYLPGKSDPVASVIVQQVHADGRAFDLATYRGTGIAPGAFTWLNLTDLVFKFPGETARADGTSITLESYSTCSGQETLNFTSNRCQNCSANTRFLPLSSKCLCVEGYYSAEGTGEAPCLPCAPGNFSTVLGGIVCDRCEVGKSASQEASTECSFCEKGGYSSELGAASCTPCPALKTTLTIASKDPNSCICSSLAYGIPGSTDCGACPSNSTSINGGAGPTAVNKTSCRCRKNMYMSSNYDSCVRCPENSETNQAESNDYPGKTSVKSCLCSAGMFMDSDLQCKPCLQNMECPVGSNIANGNVANLLKTDAERTEEERYLQLKEGYWSNAEEPLVIFKCADKNRCPGRTPGPDVCAPNLQGLACQHCVENYMWDGSKCVECASFQNNAFMFPILPIIMLFVVILGLYKFFGDAYPKWGSWQNSISTLLFIVLNHYQILGILGGRFRGAGLPQILRDSLARYDATNSVSLGFGLACVGLAELVPSMLAKAVAPAIVILATLMVYGGFQALAKFAKNDAFNLDKNRLGNVLGSLMFTFFSAISSMSLALFRCSSNPSNQPTLTDDLSVICWTSSTWLAALGIGIVCVILYIIGMGGIFLRVIYVAPRHFADHAFQMRWKFLFIKFHAGAYWWGMVFLGKNFLINFIPVVWTTEVARLYLSMTVIMVYLGMVAAKLPFRATVANVFEIMVGASILYIASLLTWFVERDVDGARENNQLGLSAVIISLGPVFAVPLGCLYLFVHGRKAHPSMSQMAKAEAEYTSIKGSFSIFSRLETVDAVGILLHMSEGDRRTLRNADFLIRTDVIGVESAMRVAGDRPEEVKRFTRRLTESAENLDQIDPLTGVPKMCCVSV